MRGSVNSIRIIAGRWRGRKIAFGDADGLRPTGDRVRETLFNWLQPILPDSHCLDLFAGSGALGFEAASRAAAKVVMVENNTGVARTLAKQIDILQADGIELQRKSAWDYIDAASAQAASGKFTAFDVVFIDPPFDLEIHHSALQRVIDGGLVADGALIYLEYGIPRSKSPKSGSKVAKGLKPAPEQTGGETGSDSEQSVAEPLPESLELVRSKQAGSVTYQLYQYTAR